LASASLGSAATYWECDARDPAVKDPKMSQRTYILYAPRNVKPGAPLLFVFHGSGGDGESMRDVTSYEFDMLADKNGFLVNLSRWLPDDLERLPQGFAPAPRA